jgi:hypothetical protein
MTTEQYLYPDREMRDLAYETEKARGTKGVTRFTDQKDGKILYVLAVPHGVSKRTQSSKWDINLTQRPAENANNTKENLTDSAESENMASEGAPNV